MRYMQKQHDKNRNTVLRKITKSIEHNSKKKHLSKVKTRKTGKKIRLQPTTPTQLTDKRSDGKVDGLPTLNFRVFLRCL